MKDSSEKYSVPSSEWLPALNELWTDENLETIKLMATAIIFKEVRPYHDNSAYNAILEQYGSSGVSPDVFSYTACNRLDTFSHLLAKIYTDHCLGDTAYERLTALAEEFIAAYKELISETERLSSTSKAALLDKLDKMEINILGPNSGYYDYSDLKLVSTEEGGTLLGNYLIFKKHHEEQELKLLNSSTHVDMP